MTYIDTEIVEPRGFPEALDKEVPVDRGLS